MTALIDGDIIMHRVGNAASKRFFTVEGWKRKYKRKAAAQEFCDKKGLPHSSIVAHKEAKGSVEDVLEAVDFLIQKILRDVDCNNYRVFLSPKKNFRHEVAVTAPYKGNRADYLRPPFFDEIKDHLIYTWGAEMYPNIEADDAMGIAQTDDTIICSLDKDLLMIAGHHYNFANEEFQVVTYEEGMKHFYKQLLMGDKTDNIIGIHGIGPKTAETLLEGLSLPEMECVVGFQYALAFDNPEERMIENGKLLWIMREEDDVCPVLC